MFVYIMLWFIIIFYMFMLHQLETFCTSSSAEREQKDEQKGTEQEQQEKNKNKKL